MSTANIDRLESMLSPSEIVLLDLKHVRKVLDAAAETEQPEHACFRAYFQSRSPLREWIKARFDTKAKRPRKGELTRIPSDVHDAILLRELTFKVNLYCYNRVIACRAEMIMWALQSPASPLRGRDLVKVYRRLHVAVALAEICSRESFHNHTMLLEQVAAPLRGVTEVVKEAVDFMNKLPGAEIDLGEIEQSARQEASGELNILAQRAKVFTLETLGRYEEARKCLNQLGKNLASKAAECAIEGCQHQPTVDGAEGHSRR
jgi:hypothetical protein